MISELFHPLIRQWFDDQFDSPTDIQSRAWPVIANREHVLITAPTGSGKTLTAFLWSINRFVTGDLETGGTRILYISPLKALNNDIQRNLITPLDQLRQLFEKENTAFPSIRVQTRSGDTDAASRRKMLRHPPEILITTPESLNLLLSSKGGQGLLYGIDTVILDEIHGVADSKRGVYLMTAVERLVPYSGEFQRIALSATINPLKMVAQLIGGYERHVNEFNPREVRIVRSAAKKIYQISVRYPEEAAARGDNEKIWDYLARDFYQRITRNSSTLLFVNSRALCEKLTFKINTVAGETIAYAHHGSLSREIRADVEQRLKAGSLAAIVATSTLEMGIDIGALDEVILVQSPGSISSSVQRIGRAGHAVGEVSRCTIYPTHPQDFIDAAVLSKAVLAGDIEPVVMISCPLDVLAQIIISMTGTVAWDIDELFMELRRSTPYHPLTRKQFDLVLNMLAGRYADNHIRELRPKVMIDRLENTIEARKGALLSLYRSGGVIPDRGYFQLRHEDSNARIGELDEEFVWEAHIGKVFAFGTQHWQVKKITHNDVIVGPGKAGALAPPFWKAEPLSRNFHYAQRVGQFLEQANASLDKEEFISELMDDFHLENIVADEIVSYLKRQKEHCQADLPHRHHLLVEKIASRPGKTSGHQIVLHTGWGAMVNRPFAMALEAAWQQEFGEQLEVFVSNESLVLQLPHELGVAELLQLVTAAELERLLRLRLEGSGFFGARFRENAGRALLLSKGRFNERKPLWMSRLQSQKLMDAVFKYEDFPILLETWRTCLKDEFDLVNLKLLLREIASNDIKVTEVATTTPSPFAQSVAWGQINTYMYMNDQPRSFKTSHLKQGLLEEVVYTPGLRPALTETLVADFEQKQRRLADGYRPANEAELVEWVKERSAIPLDEWNQLLATVFYDQSILDKKLTELTCGGGFIIAKEDKDRIEAALTTTLDDDKADLENLLRNWLQYYGPVSLATLETRFGLHQDRILPVLNQLEEERTLIVGKLLDKDDTTTWCDSRNYEFLLRLLRKKSQIEFVPLPLASLTGFLHHWQTRLKSVDPLEQIFDTIECLRCYATNAELWESEILPARIKDYSTNNLDLLFQQGDLQWIGVGEKRFAFCFRDDEELLFTETPQTDSTLLQDVSGRHDFAGLLDSTGLTAADLARDLWQGVWRSVISNDSMNTLRKGIANKFRVPDAASLTVAGQRKIRRGGFNRWRGAAPFSGNWYRVRHQQSKEIGFLELEETNKERARVVLDRYGIVFRELLAKEVPALRWSPLFRSLRLMELSGEVLSGYFFEELPGPQYMTPAAFRVLQQSASQQSAPQSVFWINAMDPVSLCGLGLRESSQSLPRRVSSNHLVYCGNRLVLVSEKQGKSLTFYVPDDDPQISVYLQVLRHLLYRSFQPIRKIEIETINDMPVSQSPYLEALETTFTLLRDHKSVYIQRDLGKEPHHDNRPVHTS